MSTRIDRVAIFKLQGANTEYTEEHGCYWVLTRTFKMVYVLYLDIYRALARIEFSFIFAAFKACTYMAMNTDYKQTIEKCRSRI